MRILFLVLTIAALSVSSSAQRPGKLIFWTGDAACGFRSPSFTKSDRIGCTSVKTDRGPVSVISLNGISLAVAFLESGEHMIVGTRITNDTADPVMFDTDQWGAAHFKTRTDNYVSQKPILAETSIPTREMLRSELFGTRIGSSADKLIAETQVIAETREIRRSDGSRYKIDVIVPDKDAQTASARRGETQMKQVILEQTRIRETALTAKSASANSFVQGLVYFRRVKEAELVVFSLKVGDTTFVFQLQRAK